MEQEVLVQVLGEILQELKTLKEQKQTAEEKAGQLLIQLESLNVRLKEQNLTGYELDTTSIEKILQTSTEEIKSLIERQPKTILQHTIQQKKVLLLPEDFRAEDFRIVFDTVLKWIIILILVLNGVSILKSFIH
jgi:hypothetical protein